MWSKSASHCWNPNYTFRVSIIWSTQNDCLEFENIVFEGHYDTFSIRDLLHRAFETFDTFYAFYIISHIHFLSRFDQQFQNLNLFLMKILTYLANPYIYKYYLYHMFARKQVHISNESFLICKTTSYS